jgi:hypothetical protein
VGFSDGPPRGGESAFIGHSSKGATLVRGASTQ